jgi:membrane protease YdiL (CAAX protease family)
MLEEHDWSPDVTRSTRKEMRNEVPGPGRVIGLLVLLLGVFLVLDGLFAVLGQHGLELPASLVLLTELTCGWSLVFYLASRSSDSPLREMCMLKPAHPKPILGATAIGLGLSLTILSLVTWIPAPAPETAVRLNEQLRATAQVPLMVALLVVGPIAEEMFFRGWVLRGWRERYGVRRAVLGTALLFGFVHVLSWQILVAFPLGLLLGWVVIKTDSVIPAILGHVGANASPRCIDPILYISGYSEDQINAIEHVPLFVPLIGLTVLLCGVTVIATSGVRSSGTHMKEIPKA